MVKSLKKDREFLREINEIRTEDGSVALWWLGQNGFVIKTGEQVIYIDPYLSDYCQENLKLDHTRLTEIPLNPELINNAAIVVVTHDHADHLDPITVSAIAKASPKCVFVAPLAAKRHLIDLGIADERIFPSNVGETLKLSGITFSPVAAKHEEFDKDECTGYPYQSYVIQCGSISIYHAGDGIPYKGLAEILLPFRIDIALLPVNGRDARRKGLGIKGNLTYQEAAELAWKIKAGTVIPMHYDMFALNNDKVENFVSYVRQTYPLQNYKVLQCGQKFFLSSKSNKNL